MLCEMSNGLLVEATINQSQGFSRVHFIKTILKLVSNDIFITFRQGCKNNVQVLQVEFLDKFHYKIVLDKSI